ncbi:MAG: class I SAM-dependent methyltransferase [Streptosporangiaceae bacterium]
MGLYERQLVPRGNNMICGSKTLNRFRRRVCAGLTGEVVEVGFGSGLNVPFYPAAVKAVAAVEPSDVAWGLAATRIQASDVQISRAGIDGESLPFGDATFDSALSTWTLCTIPDVALALRELRRVLRPGGQLHFLDHGLAPDERDRRWQRRLDPLQQRLAGGCRFTRPIAELIRAAGFTITSLDEFYVPGPKVGGADSLGVAVVPGS